MTPADSPIVFIVDDDARMRAAMQRLLKTVGLHSESFATPEEFLRQRLPNRPSCLLLDVRLPGMSGLDVQRRLTEVGAQIPIIFITGHGDIPMSVKAMKSGAVEFLTKPFRDQDLIDAIQQALKRDSANEATAERDCRIERTLREVNCARAGGHASYCFWHAHEADCFDTGHHRNHCDRPSRAGDAQDASQLPR